MNDSLRTIFGFIGGILFQVLILNNVQLLGFMTPYYYPLLILALPAVMNQHSVLIVAFLTGITIDAFEYTGALHASAALVLAYLRPVLLRLVSTQSGRELPSVSLAVLGFRNFTLYVFIGLFIHHFVLFFVDALRLSNIDIILLRTTYTTVLSLIVVLVVQGLISSPLKKST
jgi:hypothetical protein